MESLSYYLGELTPNMIYEIGIISTIFIILFAIFIFMILIIKKVKLNKKLEMEYGRRER